MIAIHIDIVKKIQVEFSDEFENQRIQALSNLQALKNRQKKISEKNYINEVIELFEIPNFLTQTPDEINAIINRMLALPSLRKTRHKIPKNERVQLTHDIQKALNYGSLRTSFYPKYFKKFGIKTCVYCNSQLTVVIQKKGKSVDGRFEVDHYYPKSEFPYLCISLFNLYPCCSSCNKRKSKGTINFELYTNDKSKGNKSSFNFKITKTSVPNFLLHKNEENIKIELKDKTPARAGFTTLNDAFNIKEIHDTQKDLVAEIIIKSQIYNESYKKTLRNSFGKLGLNQIDFDRIILSNYTKEKDIHKRPFSKLSMDIARQLGLIK